MQELLDSLRQAGYEPTNIALDGKLKRFGRNGGKDNAWFIGWQNHSVKTGQCYHVACYGDWRTGEEITYKPDKITRDDMAVVAKQIEAARKAREDDRKERIAKAALRADSFWKACDERLDAAYYERKLIDKPYGTRTYSVDGGRAIAVPMRDIDGGLWGVQRIFPDGSKRFLGGQRVDGTFHLIGADTIAGHALLCEGLATGTTLHQATELPVVCAFTAGNLITVAKALRQTYPDLALTVCGDDDRWKEPNAGRDKAGKAAMLAQAALIFPTFADLEGRPTDFNDLHAREGLDAVKRHFAVPKPLDVGFIPLGHDEGVYYFYSIVAKDVVKVTTFSSVQLFALADQSYWSEMFPSRSGTDWETAKNELIKTAQRIGPFNTSRIRGTGVWLDDGRVVVNSGHSLTVNGASTPLQGIRSWHVYVQTKKRLAPMRGDPLTVEECGLLIGACDMLTWRARESAYFLAGWLALARIAGALPIRPHVWLTGSSATGKSTVLDRIVAPCLGGPASRLYVQGGSTEAGIRQEVKSSSVPIVFDEFETTGQATSERIASFIELLRQSWSQTQGVVLKGSVSGVAVHYQLCFAALLSSIRVNLQNDADRSRFAVLELAPHNSDRAHWQRLDEMLKRITEEYGERLFARMCGMLGTVIGSQRLIADALISRGAGGQRIAQQYGTLLAGYWALQSDDVITVAQAVAMAREVDLGEVRKDAEMTDESECLNHLLTSNVTVRDSYNNAVSRSIGRIISEGNDLEHGVLKNYGVIVTAKGIMVANCHAELARIYAGTRWRDKWRASLMRIPNATLQDRAQYGAKQSRSVLIPFDAMPGSPVISPDNPPP